jgi:hypothetical protein
VALHPLWGGQGDLDRLLDADHARLQDAWSRRKAAAAWEVWPEASFNHYGDRGRVDLLSFHPATAILDVTEIKTGIWDIGDLLGRLDIKLRIAPMLAADRGWRPSHIVPSLVVAEGRTARRRIADHAALFAGFDVRGRAVEHGCASQSGRSAASSPSRSCQIPTTAGLGRPVGGASTGDRRSERDFVRGSASWLESGSARRNRRHATSPKSPLVGIWQRKTQSPARHLAEERPGWNLAPPAAEAAAGPG